MKNVLLLLHQDQGQEARFQVALGLTKALSGHLTCLDVLAPPVFLTDYVSDAGEAFAFADARQIEHDNVELIRTRLAREDVQCSLFETVGQSEEAIQREAKLADVIVVSGRTRRDTKTGTRVFAERLPLGAKRPLMAVPPESRTFTPQGPVVVAWDGSDHASQAMREAIPLLKLSCSVTLLQVGRCDGDNSLEDAEAYLSRHGIEPKLFNQPKAGSVAETIATFVRARRAAYVVMGAYGVSRVLENVVGGVTRSMLLWSEVPLFLVH
jgi:nucleotide-binding universal stress UspA family protein